MTEPTEREALEALFARVHFPRPPSNPGSEAVDWFRLHNPFYAMLEAKAYLDAALMLVPPGASWNLVSEEKDLPPQASIYLPNDLFRTFTGQGTTPALALCAAIKAAIARVGE